MAKYGSGLLGLLAGSLAAKAVESIRREDISKAAAAAKDIFAAIKKGKAAPALPWERGGKRRRKIFSAQEENIKLPWEE